MATKKKTDRAQDVQDLSVVSHVEETERKRADLQALNERMQSVPNAIGVAGATGSSVADAANIPAGGTTITGGGTNG
jgi:hypothetical protein